MRRDRPGRRLAGRAAPAEAARRARPASAFRQRRRRRARCRHRARALLGRRRGAALSPAPDRAAPLRPGLGDPLPPEPGAAAAPADRHARPDRPVRGARRPPAGVEPPDPAVLDSAGVSSAALSVVRVVGNACGLGIEGSGWIAGNGLVVTNAHVVAGVDVLHVDRNDGDLLGRPIVLFDKTNDVAVLRVAGLQAPPLKLADVAPGTPGGLLGYPGNGPYAETAVRVGRIVPSSAATRTATFRSAGGDDDRGVIRSGNSGGPVVDARGHVVTTVFAQRVGTDGGYGVPNTAVRAALAPQAPVRRTSCTDR